MAVRLRAKPIAGSSMSQNRIKRIALYATAGIGLLVLLVGLFFAIERRRTQAETGAVLSALFSQDILRDIDKWGAGHPTDIVIQRKPDCRLCPPVANDMESWFAESLKLRRSTLSDAWFAQSSRITRTSFFVNSIFSTDVSADLTLPQGARAIFINPSDLGTKPGDVEQRFPDNLGYFVVSHIGLNLKKNEALLYIERFCAGLCGGGEYVLMRKVNGVWQIVDHHSTWVS